MSLGILITIAASGSALIAYALIERRLNQRACPYCRFRVSVVALDEECPRCCSYVQATGTSRKITENDTRILPEPVGSSGQFGDSVTRSSEPAETKHRERTPSDSRLAKVVLIGLPLLVITIDSAVLIYRAGRRRTDKAISLVQTSSSRIENFTVQQYLYATLFESRRRGADVIIQGWQGRLNPADDHHATVEFDFSKDGLVHAAVWAVDVPTGTVTAITEEASHLSWGSS